MVTKIGKAIRAEHEAPLTPLVPEGERIDPKFYARFLDAMTQIAPELVAKARR